MKIGEKIRKVRKSRGMTISDLALSIDSDVGNISRLERGVQGYSDKTLNKIANALNIPISQLFISDDASDTVDNNSIVSAERNEGVFMVEILDIPSDGKQHGEVAEIIKRIDYSPEEAKRIFGGLPQGRVSLVNARGDGMQGTIEPGDLVFIDKGVKFFDGDGIYLFIYNDDFYIKRLQKIKSEILVISDNPRYQKWSLNPDEQQDLVISGRVILSQSQEMRRHG
jgi:phage repressor protein C with HTH and peptisase S24 domain